MPSASYTAIRNLTCHNTYSRPIHRSQSSRRLFRAPWLHADKRNLSAYPRDCSWCRTGWHGRSLFNSPTQKNPFSTEFVENIPLQSEWPTYWVLHMSLTYWLRSDDRPQRCRSWRRPYGSWGLLNYSDRGRETALPSLSLVSLSLSLSFCLFLLLVSWSRYVFGSDTAIFLRRSSW